MTHFFRNCGIAQAILTLSLSVAAFAQDAAIDAGAQGAAPEIADAGAAVEPLGEGGDDAATQSEPVKMEWLRAAKPDTVVCPFRGRIKYEPGEIECGLIKVPENREVAGSRTIELNYVRIVATGKNQDDETVETRDDPVIYLTGGPGVTIDSYVERLKDHRLVYQRDLYILEQRGIGNSGDFCPFFDSRNRASLIHADRLSSERAGLDQFQACIEGAVARGVDVRGYNTFENARDIRALRQALGLEEWNVWGISYGSVLGQAYIKVDPDGIRAAIIDAIVPLDLGELMRLAHWHNANLDRLFAACANQSACAREYEGLRPRYMAAIKAIEDSPVTVTFEPNEQFPTGEAHFFSIIIAGLPFVMMYEQENHPALLPVIDALTRIVESGDPTFFQALAQAMSMGDGGMGGGMSAGMAGAVRCLDGYVASNAAFAGQDAELYPVLFNAFDNPTIAQEAAQRCREIGLPTRDFGAYAPVQTDLPVVVADGGWDPITPVPLAEYIMPGFSNGQLVIFPHAGHGPTRSVECAGDWMNAWYDDPSQPVGRECVEEGEEAAQFLAPYFRTSVAIDALALMNQNKDRLKLHGAWVGVSAGLTLLAALFLPLSWLGRRINRSKLKPAGGSRVLVFLATGLGAAWLVGLGLAAYLTSEIAELMLLFGMVPWAAWIAWLGPLSVLFALLALNQTWRNRQRIPGGSRFGLILSCLAVISLGVAGQIWSLWPF
ncbi:MAG: alpha/beta fold hydrolase [Xanthomonadales bacterium]|nr:alpha/beta fold hydrolase [Xanthomonadales bacterium]